MYKIIFCIFLCVIFYGCGYKPMAYFANKALGDKVCVILKPNMENIEESVRIKDAINESIYTRFHSRIVSESEADSILRVDVTNIKDSIIATNSQGFATFYRINIVIRYTFNKEGKEYSFVNPGYYDYAASLTSPLITYNNRSVAIVEAAKQSLDRFISQVGYSGSF